MLSAALAGPAPAQTDPKPEKPRVAVIAEPESSAHSEKRAWVPLAITQLTNGLLDQGQDVVALGPPPRSGAGRGERVRAWSDYTEVLIGVGVRSVRERKQQGRYRVTDRLELRVLDLMDGSTLLERTRSASGHSFAGYAAAHRDVIGRLCTRDSGGLLADVLSRLAALEEVERREGALMTIKLTADQQIPGLEARFAASLGKLPGVRAETVSLLASRSRTADGSASTARTPAMQRVYRLRYRGPGRELSRALLDMTAGLVAELGADRARPALHITASRRRISLHLGTDPRASEEKPDPSPGDMVKQKVGRLADRLLLEHRRVIANARVAVEPATIRTNRKSPSVDRPRGDRVAGEDGGPVGELARAMRTAAVDHLEAGGLHVLPDTADSAVATRRAPGSDPGHGHDFDPEVVKTLRRAGADAAVFPGLVASPPSYVLNLVLVDCATGTELSRLGQRLDERDAAALDALMNG